MPIRQVLTDRHSQRPNGACGPGYRIALHVGLVRKVDRCLDQGLRLDNPGPPPFVKLRKPASSLRKGLPPLSLGLRVDQVGQPLGFG